MGALETGQRQAKPYLATHTIFAAVLIVFVCGLFFYLENTHADTHTASKS